ncbi:MAG: hydrogenase maturation nickel metallochaperone HypA [Chloroflexi bacterium]|nr:MAG: hydrogenase maturation nickel metallochaperone HypA [Chloroflexota bacterium]
MHEMRTAQRLVDEAVELMAEERAECVTDIEVVLDSAARLTADSVRQQFEVAAHGTPAEGAALHVRLAPGRYWCVDCTFEFSSLAPCGGACPRCGRRVLSLDGEAAAHVVAIGVAAP